MLILEKRSVPVDRNLQSEKVAKLELSLFLSCAVEQKYCIKRNVGCQGKRIIVSLHDWVLTMISLVANTYAAL